MLMKLTAGPDGGETYKTYFIDTKKTEFQNTSFGEEFIDNCIANNNHTGNYFS